MYLDIIESLCLKPIKRAEFIRFHDEQVSLCLSVTTMSMLKIHFDGKRYVKGN